ncbi:hypothetical protein OS493_006906 [Desmophyllum pertusum]|uniref:Uncharacterized protein n=1 Tax=Desmophyllum pertusum TaxID=174260 RepID=A0A9W9ZS44_9CNID|nr:hypothetical protein OS493_006906 [Desmophyllum pertusum]
MLTKLTLLPLDPLAERPATGVDIPDTLEKLVQWEQREVEDHLAVVKGVGMVGIYSWPGVPRDLNVTQAD